MDYLLGTNPLSFSYITGYGTYHEQNPYHKYWSYDLDPFFPKAPDGVLSGGPNAGLQDSYVIGMGFRHGKDMCPSQRCFVDSLMSWSTNGAAVNWNSPLAWVASFLQDEADKVSADNPVTDKPVTDKSITDKPVTDKSVTQAPVTDKPVADKSVTQAPGKDFMYGDVDGNGKAEITDLSCLSLYLLHDNTLTGNAMKAADVNGNGEVDLADLAHLKQFICKDAVTLGPKK